jgi:endo-1,4-beta-mannosidase
MRRSDGRLNAPAWLGANFWSRTGGPLMWRHYDPAVIEDELAVLRANGLNLTRSFFHWPDFHPEPDRLDETMVQRFEDFLDRHVDVGLATVPTFLVGHCAGENWDPAWRGGRDLYRDVWLVARQAWYVRELTARFAGHPAVAGWLISNEMPLYAGKAPAEVVSSWAQLMIDAVRAGGGRQPVSLGDGGFGAIDPASGYDPRRLSAMVDWSGPHTYRMADDLLGAAFACELARLGGQPVVLEEFGMAGADAADHYRQVLHTTLLAGATGWLARNSTDLDHIGERRPLFETEFGLTTGDGKPKPQLLEMGRFAATLAEIDFDRCERLPVDAALVIPSCLDTDNPFTTAEDRSHAHRALRQGYVAARQADLALGFEHESDGIAEGYLLYLAPSVKQLTAPAWRRLAALAEQGATVYASYGSARGPWWLDDLFGVEHRRPDRVPDGEARFAFRADFGSLRAGDELVLDAGRDFLPVRPTTADVVAVDTAENPALLVRRHGAGRLVLCTYPVEHMANAHRLYDALAEAAEVYRPMVVADPRVTVDGLRHADGREWLCVVNLSPDRVELCDGLVLSPYGVEWLTEHPLPGPGRLR